MTLRWGARRRCGTGMDLAWARIIPGQRCGLPCNFSRRTGRATTCPAVACRRPGRSPDHVVRGGDYIQVVFDDEDGVANS